MFGIWSAFPYPKFKLVILALLSLNVFIYAAVDTLTSTFDALAWLGLLVMFELETLSGAPLSNQHLHRIRNGLIALIILVFFSYLQDHQWLDVVNALLWFVLIALLEVEVRLPHWVAQYRQAFWITTVAVFVLLLGMVVIWLAQSAWLDAYDAALWMVAFVVIEVDIFRFLQLKPR